MARELGLGSRRGSGGSGGGSGGGSVGGVNGGSTGNDGVGGDDGGSSAAGGSDRDGNGTTGSARGGRAEARAHGLEARWLAVCEESAALGEVTGAEIMWGRLRCCQRKALRVAAR